MTLLFGTGIICGIAMNLTVAVKEQDYDKTWNYLFASKQTPQMTCNNGIDVSGEVYLSWSQPKPLPFNEGEVFRANVQARCYAGGGIDESIKEYWASYRVWSCTITELEF